MTMSRSEAQQTSSPLFREEEQEWQVVLKTHYHSIDA